MEYNVRKILFFKSSGCPHCPIAERNLREVIKEEGVRLNVEVLLTDTPRGMKKARKYGVMSVPTTLIIKEDGEILGLRGVRSKDKLRELLFGVKRGENRGERKGRVWSVVRKILGL